jgi:hypothetical protein
MIRWRFVLCFALAVAVSGVAAADLKITQKTHRDAFSVMGQDQPAKDSQRTIWIGDDRMRFDEDDSTIIVRLDQMKMYLIDHADRTVTELDLPFNVKEHLPEGFPEQMMDAMRFEVTVTPSDETRSFGDWTARRYDLSMVSQMVTVKSEMWATKQIEYDREGYLRMLDEMLSMQPGLADLSTELKKVEGFVVSQDTVTTMTMMGGSTMGSNEQTVSAVDAEAPAATYERPSDYTDKPFDFMEAMQNQ